MKTIAQLAEARLSADPGKGKGQGFAPRGAGGTDTCVCPNCGTTVQHTRGSPCNSIKCPECDSAMQGSTD